MTDIKVPHEYLDTLRHIRSYSVMGVGERVEVLDALIAAAEADRPPLPEGWVVLDEDGSKFVYWHEDNRLYSGRGENTYRIEATAASMRDRLTPLRPTFTEADIEKAARATRAAYFGEDTWDVVHGNARDVWKKNVRATLDALGIEVSG